MTTVQINNHNTTVNTNIKLLESNSDSLTTTAKFKEVVYQTNEKFAQLDLSKREGEIFTEQFCMSAQSICVVDKWKDFLNFLSQQEIPNNITLVDSNKLRNEIKILRKAINDKMRNGINSKFKTTGKTINKKIKVFEKQIKIKESEIKQKIKAKQNNQNFIETILKIQEVARARFSHSTIAQSTAHGEEQLSLEELEEIIIKTGWKKSAPKLKLYMMPDGKYTSYDNRRLWVLKRILEKHPNSNLNIPVAIYQPDMKHKQKDIVSLKIGLQCAMKKEKTNQIKVEENVGDFRQILLDEQKSLEQTSLKPNTNLHHIFLRIYVDAGKPEALSRAEPVNLQNWKHPVILGYNTVRVRQEALQK